MITPTSTLADALALPGMSELTDMILMTSNPRTGKGATVIQDMDNPKSPIATDVAGVVYALNGMAELAAQGKLRALQVYSPSQIQDCPDKAVVKLAWFGGNPVGPFAIVCPGGGYMTVATLSEGFPTAMALHQRGVNVFVLQYRTGLEGAVPCAIDDLRAAVSCVLENSHQLGVEKSYALMGFSAGGHLATEFCTDNVGYAAAGLPKPQALVLGYPYVGVTEDNIIPGMLHKDDFAAELATYSPLDHLSCACPPTFVWQTREDAACSFDQNAQALHDKLTQLGVAVQLREAHGRHGMGLMRGTEGEAWLDEALAFWRAQQ